MTLLFCGFMHGGFMQKVVESVANESDVWASVAVDYNRVTEFPVYKVLKPGLEMEFDPLKTMRADDGFGWFDFAGVPDDARRAFYVSMDRVFLTPASLTERESLLFRYMRGMNALIETHFPNPGTAYFTSTPHFHWDIALSICLQNRGWSVRCFTICSESQLLLVKTIKGSQTDELVKLRSADLVSTSGPSNAVSANLAQSKDFNKHVLRPVDRSFPKIARFLFRLLKVVLQPQRFHYFPQSRLTLILLGFAWAKNRTSLRRWLSLNGLTSLPDSDFVYFALHSQPERSTVPDAGAHWYQANAILELRRVLAPEITIVVGEHPRQIGRQGPDLRQTHYRSPVDYQNIASIPNTLMAHWTLESNTLISKALFVATCTGSTGWQALTRGVPALNFAPAWYSTGSAGNAVWDARSNMATAVLKLSCVSRETVLRGVKRMRSLSHRYGIAGLDSSVESLPGSAFGLDSTVWEQKKKLLGEKMASTLLQSYLETFSAHDLSVAPLTKKIKN